jgi:hypothetical protein
MVPEATSRKDAQLEGDVEIAARTSVPVLITAGSDRARDIALAIAARSGPAGAGPIQVCDRSAGDNVLTAVTEAQVSALRGTSARTILFPEVHMLSEIEQDAVMSLFDAARSPGLEAMPRIITTSSISLLDRVEQGAFDARLFHRLNMIHIVVPASEAPLE